MVPPCVTEDGTEMKLCRKLPCERRFFLPLSLSLYRVMQVDFIYCKSSFLLSALGKLKSLILLHTLHARLGNISFILPIMNPVSSSLAAMAIDFSVTPQLVFCQQ